MVICFAAYCSHRGGRDKCSFFRFPKDPKEYAVWKRISRRADKKPTNDSRLCSCHFKDGKKENGPTIFFYREGKQFDFPDPEKRFKRKVLADLEDAPNPDGSPSLNLNYFFDSARKLRERKHKNIQNCPCCDAYTPCNSIHKKYKRSYPKKNIIEDNETPSRDKKVNIVKIINKMVTSSSDISELKSNSGEFHLVPIKIGNLTIYRYLPTTDISSDTPSSALTSENALLEANGFGDNPLTVTNYIPSATLTQADIPFRTDKFVNSHSILQSSMKIKSEETLLDNLESVHESDVDFVPNDTLSSELTTEKVLFEANGSGDNPLTITNYIPSTTLTPADILFRTDKFINSPTILQSSMKIKSEETLSDNLESVQENDLHESDVDSVQNGSSDSVSESNISSTSEQINNVTHAEAFCATETLLHYMMNQDDVNSTDINFILNLAQKIKERLSVKKENVTENL